MDATEATDGMEEAEVMGRDLKLKSWNATEATDGMEEAEVMGRSLPPT